MGYLAALTFLIWPKKQSVNQREREGGRKQEAVDDTESLAIKKKC